MGKIEIIAGNGAKAAMKRERNAKDSKGGESQLKVNEKAKSVQCMICRQTFLMTVKKPALESHLESKHQGKDFSACFPAFG